MTFTIDELKNIVRIIQDDIDNHYFKEDKDFQLLNKFNSKLQKLTKERVKSDFKKKKPFYFDVDDTILTENGEGSPFAYSTEVLQGLIDAGYEVNIWSARGKDWAEHVATNILGISGCNAYLTKPSPDRTFDDKPERMASRLSNVKQLLCVNDWYDLGMKFLKWKKLKPISKEDLEKLNQLIKELVNLKLKMKKDE